MDEGREPTAAERREIEREARQWAKAEADRRRARASHHATASERRLLVLLMREMGGAR